MIAQFQTPMWCADIMAALIPDTAKTILEPTPGIGNLSKAITNKTGIKPTETYDFWNEISRNSRFDCVVMNPPFSPMKEGYKILFRCMDASNEIIALMPWLTIINGERRLKIIRDFGLKTVLHLPRRTFLGARVQCCILHLRKDYQGQSNLLFV